MLPIDRCRQILGASANGLSDQEIEHLRDQLYGMAQVALSLFLESRRPSAQTSVEKQA